MSPLTILLVQGQLKELLSTYFTHVSAVYATFKLRFSLKSKSSGLLVVQN